MGKNLRMPHPLRTLLAVGVLLGTIGAPCLWAEDPVCDAKSWKGAFGYRLTGFVYDTQGYTYFLTAAGRMVSDGEGNLKGADTFSFDGSILKREYTGTYTINSDCTGSLTITTTSGNETRADLVLVNNGNEAEFVQTDQGYIVSGSLKSQTPTVPASTPVTPVPEASKR